MDLKTFQHTWADTPEAHAHTNDLFRQLVDADPQLKAHRNFVEQHVFGFGEHSFWYLWKLVLQELPKEPSMLEIGIFKGATISLWQMLRPDALVWGVSPMNGAGTGWTEDDYWAHVNYIYEKFNADLPHESLPVILLGYSEEEGIIKSATREYDLVYVDGGHAYETALSDLKNYAPMVKTDGYLVIDDCACDMHEPFGFFQGIADVQKAFDEYMSENEDKWEFVGNVVHLRIMRRK